MCGCQGNNKPFTPPDVTLPNDEYVRVRYVGHRGGINPYPGANGGYRFGTQRREGIVTTEDANRLLALHEGGKPAFELVTEATASPVGGEQQPPPDDNPKPPSGNDGGTETPPPDPVVNVPPPVNPQPVQRSVAPKPATGSTSSPTKPAGKHKPGSRGK